MLHSRRVIYRRTTFHVPVTRQKVPLKPVRHQHPRSKRSPTSHEKMIAACSCAHQRWHHVCKRYHIGAYEAFGDGLRRRSHALNRCLDRMSASEGSPQIVRVADHTNDVREINEIFPVRQKGLVRPTILTTYSKCSRKCSVVGDRTRYMYCSISSNEHKGKGGWPRTTAFNWSNMYRCTRSLTVPSTKLKRTLSHQHPRHPWGDCNM